jgi:hypothetical protein
LLVLAQGQAGEDQVIAEFPLHASPASAFVRELDGFAPDASVTLQWVDGTGKILLEYSSGDEVYVQAGVR